MILLKICLSGHKLPNFAKIIIDDTCKLCIFRINFISNYQLLWLQTFESHAVIILKFDSFFHRTFFIYSSFEEHTFS